ncbi:hypothetical protein IMCC20628_04888 (plasmid) [Hoeflea sp. IMCC20628]|nr:hypothetical protein IMCC20628_04888 [Hoeflea sp. IMCC20628]
MGMPGSETTILLGTNPIPSSKFSILHSGYSSQHSQEPIQGFLKTFLNTEISIRECRPSILKAQLPIPVQTAMMLSSHVMGAPTHCIDQVRAVEGTGRSGWGKCSVRCRRCHLIENAMPTRRSELA